MNSMLDQHGRRVTYLRLSVTDRCDYRCVYCMSERVQFMPRTDLLDLDELAQIGETFIHLGVRTIRITGGEPLVRKGILNLLERFGRSIIPRSPSGEAGLYDLTLTTNGSQLASKARDLVSAGVRRVNVSLDSLDAEQFRAITRRGDLSQVLRGLDAACLHGLRVKINTVALRGINDHEIDKIVAFCGERGFDLSFIEVMPMGDIGNERRFNHYWRLIDVKKRIEETWNLSASEYRTPGPSRYYDCLETGTRIGFIAPLSHRFCESCNRVRVSATGRLYLCLGQEDGADLRQILRATDKQNKDHVLAETIHRAIWHKPAGHDFVIDRDKQISGPDRLMHVTGG